jgi:predicted MFS family arabinose efflux permease
MVLLLAAACGAVVGNLYYAQPLLGVIGPALHMEPRAASLIVSLTQLGYALGLVLLVPLGDLLENRRLMVLTILSAIPALLLAATAQSGTQMLAAAALIGVTSVAVQMIIPLAAHMTPEHQRGQVVGTVVSGLLTGILLARPIASGLTALSGWRIVFYLSAALMLVLAVVLRARLPERQPEHQPGKRSSYAALLASLVMLPVRVKVLRQRALVQAACFAGFSLFWTGAPLLLMREFGLTQAGIALFGLAGAAGTFVAPLAGRLGDRGYVRPGTFAALVLLCLSFGIAWLGEAVHSVLLLALAAIVLDAGVQTSLVLGQRVIFSEAPEMRSRLNGLFIALFFLGGAAGSAVTGALLQHGGWAALCALGAVLPLAALAYYARAR